MGVVADIDAAGSVMAWVQTLGNPKEIRVAPADYVLIQKKTTARIATDDKGYFIGMGDTKIRPWPQMERVDVVDLSGADASVKRPLTKAEWDALQK